MIQVMGEAKYMLLMDIARDNQNKQLCMLVNGKYNNKTTRMNKSSIICDKIKYLKSKSVSEFCFKLCSYENIKTGVKCGLNHKKIPYVAKLNIRNYNLQK